MAYTSTTTNGINWTGIQVSAGSSPEPARVPKALIATRAVELKDGWTGQVIVGGEVLLEDTGYKTAETAEAWATQKVLDCIKLVFTAPRSKRG